MITDMLTLSCACSNECVSIAAKVLPFSIRYLFHLDSRIHIMSDYYAY